MKLIYALSMVALAVSTSACSPTQFASITDAASMKAGGGTDGVTPSRGGGVDEQADSEEQAGGGMDGVAPSRGGGVDEQADSDKQAGGDKGSGDQPVVQTPTTASPGLCANNASIDRWGPAALPANLESAPLEISVLNNRMIREQSGRVRVLFQFKNELGRVASVRASAWCQGMDLPTMGLSDKTMVVLQPFEVRKFEMYYPAQMPNSARNFDLCYFTFENLNRVDAVKCSGPIE